MSSWKKASKANQRMHQERHQPIRRSHFGLLEKHKDYVLRARDYQRKQTMLNKLKEYALSRNPDEYYHHMVNSQLVNDKHREKEKPSSHEHKKILENLSLQYVKMKLKIEQKKTEKIQSQLHLIDNPCNKQFASEIAEELLDQPKLMPNKKFINQIQKLKERSYKTLAKSIERVDKLSVIKNKMEVQLQVNRSKRNCRPKCVDAGSKTKSPIYVWKYERKS